MANTSLIRLFVANSEDATKELPSPVSLSREEEIIWSANTGRSITPSDGALMMGDVIAEKVKFSIEWGVLTQAEYNKIKTLLASGFHPFTLKLGSETITISQYRGVLSGQLLGAFGGEVFYKSASVNIIQR